MSGISFKITAPGRPTSAASSAPPSRPQSRTTSRHNSHQRGGATAVSEDDSEPEDGDAFRRASGRDNKRRKVDEEEVIEFGKDGATSKHGKPQPAAPLVIPALPNKDWRKAAEELRAGRKPGKKRELYLPERGGGMKMRDGDASGEPSTPLSAADVDAINTEEVVGGLERRERRTQMEVDESEPKPEFEEATPTSTSTSAAPPKQEETEEQRAMRELLGEAGGPAKTEEAELEAIYSAEDARNGPIEEADAFKRDVDSRPDEASLEDYARVPVGAFGLAMLRGMGWKPGQAASRSGRGAIEAHVPSSRPSLLGIGAKPMAEAMGDDKKSSKGKNGTSAPAGKSRREEMKFMPLVKQAREGSASGRSTPLPITDGSTSSSRRPSRSPPPSSSSRHRERDRSPRREREREERRSSKYDDDDRRRRSRYDDDRKSSRHDDDRRSSRYDDDRRSSRRDEGERRRDSDRDRRYRDGKEDDRRRERR
ncbi:hypothetical protein JCM3765_001541 [Sporobolomyces pararoseus]